MNIIRVGIFGLIVLIVLAVSYFLAGLVIGFIGQFLPAVMSGIVGLVLTWVILSLLAGFLITKIALRFKP